MQEYQSAALQSKQSKTVQAAILSVPISALLLHRTFLQIQYVPNEESSSIHLGYQHW